MWDGISLPVSVFYPVTKDPAEEFPIIICVHGWTLGKSIMEWAAEYYASRGYIGPAFTARVWFDAGGAVGCMGPVYEMKDVSHIITLLAQDERPGTGGRRGSGRGHDRGVHGRLFLLPHGLQGRRSRRSPLRAVVPMHGSFDLL
ncbi:MAG: hypothetical protein SWK76_06720 [Actinomycetota bacterium]|nr:hypothetical protein [Actinomycetota bacterium]